MWGTKIEHNFFSQTFGHRRDILSKSRDIRPKKFDFPGFEGHTEHFGPHPFAWKTPTPTRKYPDQKVWVWVPFSSLIMWLIKFGTFGRNLGGNDHNT